MQELLKAIASGLVERPEEVSVTSEENDNGVMVYHLHVAEEDMGRVIGKPVSYTHLRAQRLLSISYAVFCLKKIFFNDTATTEIYTSLIVGSVRCV